MAKNQVQFQKGLSLSDFILQYGTEKQCVAALERWRWPEGFRCDACGHDHFCQLSTGRRYQCNRCHHQTRLTAGTIFHSTNLPLTKWFLAIYLMTQSKNGISQLELGRQVGVSPNTAASLYHKIAHVMMERDLEKPLSGDVEADDAWRSSAQPLFAFYDANTAEGSALRAALRPAQQDVVQRIKPRSLLQSRRWRASHTGSSFLSFHASQRPPFGAGAIHIWCQVPRCAPMD